MYEEIANTPIEQVEGREPARVSPATTLDVVVKTMADQRRGAALVEDEDGRLLGIFTEHDLMTRLDHSNHDWHKMKVEEIMLRDPEAIQGNQTISEALQMMLDGRFRHLPIINDDKGIQGVVSIRGIMVHVVSYFAEELLNLPPDTEHETSKPWGG